MTNQYLWDRIAGRDAHIRAADADRERIAERLRKGHAEGRLDIAEFQQRLECCYEARTFGELEELVRDLPRQGERDERQTSRLVRQRGWRLTPLVAILLALLVLSTATGHHHHIWWLWIPLMFVFWRMFTWRRRRWWAGPRHQPGEWI